MFERFMDGLPLAHPQPGTWPTTEAMCPDQESNQRPFSSEGTQSTEPHQSRCNEETLKRDHRALAGWSILLTKRLQV